VATTRRRITTATPKKNNVLCLTVNSFVVIQEETTGPADVTPGKTITTTMNEMSVEVFKMTLHAVHITEPICGLNVARILILLTTVAFLDGTPG
jgi:hypothetical protein